MLQNINNNCSILDTKLKQNISHEFLKTWHTTHRKIIWVYCRHLKRALGLNLRSAAQATIYGLTIRMWTLHNCWPYVLTYESSETWVFTAQVAHHEHILWSQNCQKASKLFIYLWPHNEWMNGRVSQQVHSTSDKRMPETSIVFWHLWFKKCQNDKSNCSIIFCDIFNWHIE